MREANKVGTKIISIEATRLMCSACQVVSNENGIIDIFVTPLKKQREEVLWMNYINRKYQN